MADLTPTQNDSYNYLVDLFTSYGIGSLAPAILQLVQSGASDDTITLSLKQTPEYQNRFAANKKRLSQGKPELSPAEYLATERAYSQLMSAAGLPPGFYDQPSDFQSFLENDVAPTELQDRVNLASEAYYNSPETMKLWRDQGGSDGEFIAMALDTNRATPLIRQRIRSLEAQAIGQQAGITLDTAAQANVAASGADLGQIRQGVNFVAQEAANAAKLGQLNGTDITTGDLTAEAFLQDAEATRKRKNAVDAEAARFGGSSGASQTTLSKSGSGTV